MGSRIKSRAIALIALLSLGACAPQISPVDFTAGGGENGKWSLGGVSVTIPDSIVVSTSTEDRYPPSDQLVWWGDPPGDRKAQVVALMEDAVNDGAAAALQGAQPVDVEVVIRQFHAMSPIARATSFQAGVHEIRFDIAIRDAGSGEILAEEKGVNADFRAYSGSKAVLAEARGEDQKTRIKERVSNVVASWIDN